MTLTPNLLLVGGIAGLAAMAAVGVVMFNNAVRSALCLVVNFILLAILYFTLGAEAIGITQVIVYTGAIMVLFLFVIMLLNLGAANLAEERADWKRPVGIMLGVVLFGLVGSQILPPMLALTQPAAPDQFGSFPTVGRSLFTNYVIPFEAVSVLLLIGIVGSILLAKRRIG